MTDDLLLEALNRESRDNVSVLLVLPPLRPVALEMMHVDPSSLHEALASSFAHNAVVTGVQMLTAHLGTSRFKPVVL